MSDLYKPLNFNVQKPYKLPIPNECPLCHCYIVPDRLTDCLFKNNTGDTHLSIIFCCPKCQKPFFAHFRDFPFDHSSRNLRLAALAPNKPIKREFSPEIIKASPNFSRIYDEAAFAEACGLLEITGIGYRKALEFLLKEYLITKYPEDEDFIRKKSLSDCIDKFITDLRIKPVAKLCNRLGNDHTHFTRKYEDKDIIDLKKYFDATIHWIEMELITEGARNDE